MSVRFDLEDTFLGLAGDGEITRMPVGPDFWSTLDANPAMRGTMISVLGGDGDWTTWEMHPEGDEVLVMLEGALTLVCDDAGTVTRHDLRPGTTFIVPAGVWHRAVGQQAAKLMFITYGAGTTHRPA